MSKITGIYQIVNTINNNCYIGSSVDIINRVKKHVSELKKNKHHSILLQRAYNKYGEKVFCFIVLNECEKEHLIFFEQKYLDYYEPEYNISKDAKAPMTGRKHKKETIEKFKKIKRLKGKDHYAYGKKWTKEQREKILSKRIGSKRNEKTRLKMSNTAKRINSISRINRENKRKKIIDNLGNIFNSLTEAAKFHQVSIPTVCDILKKRHNKTRKGIIFYYKI